MENKAVLSIGWLFGGNYTYEQTEEFSRIIEKFEDLAYLERENILEILTHIFEERISDEDIINTLNNEYEK